MNETVLNATKTQFINKYVLTPAASQPVPPAPEGEGRMGVSEAAIDTIEQISRAHSKWQGILDEIHTKDVPTQIRQLDGIDREIATMRELVKRDRSAIPENLLTIAERRLDETEHKSFMDRITAMNERTEFGVNEAAKNTAERFAKNYSHWQKRIEKLPTMEPRDRFLNLKWLERDTADFQRLVDRDRTTMPEGLLSTADRRLERLKTAATQGYASLQTDMEKLREQKIKTDWPTQMKTAGGLKGKDLLKAYEALEMEKATLQAQFQAVGMDTSAIDAMSFQALRDKYDSGLPTLTATAEPVDATRDTEKPLTYSEQVCKDIYKLYNNNWFDLKKAYKTPEFLEKIKEKFEQAPTNGTDVMWQLWAFRKKTVDGKMRALEKKYELEGEGTGWVAVGSVNLESDYDISVMKHGKKADDHVIVKDFNQQFQSEFGTQPGMLFDTNLYASAPPKHSLPEQPETPAEKAMVSMARSGQDVGALMKQRRFMTWDEYETFMQNILTQMEKDGASAGDMTATRTQFEEADARYQMSQVAILEKTRALLAGKATRTPDEQDALDMVTDAINKANTETSAASAKALMEAAHALEGHKFEKVLLEVNNDIYVTVIEEVRKIQAEIAELSTQLGESPDPAKQEEMNGKIARAKDLFSDAVFYANEAYHSEGPFQHIVEATQAVESTVMKEKGWKKPLTSEQNEEISKKRKEMRGALSLQSCLQSFNENLGDFVKDLKHYDSEDLPGSGFYRSSKYLDRLFDAAILLDQKAREADPAITFDPKVPGLSKDIPSLQKSTQGGLLALRKGKIKVRIATPPLTPQQREEMEPTAIEDHDAKCAKEEAEQIQAYAINQVQSLFGVNSLSQFSDMFKRYGVSVNAQLRKAVAEEMAMLKQGNEAFFA